MKQTILQSWQDQWPVIKINKSLPTGEGVIDERAFNTIEIDELFDSVNHGQTIIGQTILYRSLTAPLDSIESIKAKQDAVEELNNNADLRQSIENIVQTAAEQEKDFYLLLYGEFLGAFGSAKDEHEIEGFGYLQYKRGTRLLLNLVEHIKTVQTPSQPYLQAIFSKITAFADSRAYSLMQGPAYISEQGIQSKEDRKNSFSPAIIFTPRLFKPLLIALLCGLLWLTGEFFPATFFKISAQSISTASIFFVPLLLIYFPIVGGFDRDNCIIPLRNIYKNATEVGDALEALGQLDELLAFLGFAQNFGSVTVMPELEMAKQHQIHLVAVKNPVLGKQNSNYVGNDFNMTSERLVFITGPNSGGKTAFCKTITQIQVLAQIGCYVPAQTAKLSVADKIFYQAPEISHLDDGEGRFGTELKRTRDIFLATTAQSLVVLDELSEGTTFEEKMESSTNVLDGFYRKASSTILITHNHQLVDHFVKQGIGSAKQVEFANDAPTYKLIPGISRVSHADRVAKKIGFSKEDIDNYLSHSK
ncbi:MAG: DNA mismatch repair protein MutS [Methylococcaceae bacterium]|jgi:hypothetical protein